MILQVLLLAAAALLCQSTTAYYKPYIYRQSAPVYVQPAPLKYVVPVTVKAPPKPYSFAYNAPAIGGGSSRQETSDGNGRVVGSYSITDIDGRARVVDYYADETGFHANVQTNEPGTANQNPADVSVQSFAAPPVLSQKVITTPTIVASRKYIAPRPIYSYPAPITTVTKRLVAPLTYKVVPTYNYNTVAYAPLPYGNYYTPHKLAYWK